LVTGGAVGLDGVYRDPWKAPYIISMDLSFSKFTRDGFYRYAAVSQTASGSPVGFNGLNNPLVPFQKTNNFDFSGGVMVWSAGPDGKIDATVNAQSGLNADNLRSW